MTTTAQHYAAPANAAELLGATHAWRSMLRQAAAQLAMIAAHAPVAADRGTQRALEDTVTDLNRACARLTTITTTHNPLVAPRRRDHCGAQPALPAATHGLDRPSCVEGRASTPIGMAG